MMVGARILTPILDDMPQRVFKWMASCRFQEMADVLNVFGRVRFKMGLLIKRQLGET